MSGDPVGQSRAALVSPQSDVTSGHSRASVTPCSFGPQSTLPPQTVKQRTRSRSSRGSTSSKRVSVNANRQVADPAVEEEMERTIQNIVAKALEVGFF